MPSPYKPEGSQGLGDSYILKANAACQVRFEPHLSQLAAGKSSQLVCAVEPIFSVSKTP